MFAGLVGSLGYALLFRATLRPLAVLVGMTSVALVPSVAWGDTASVAPSSGTPPSSGSAVSTTSVAPSVSVSEKPASDKPPAGKPDPTANKPAAPAAADKATASAQALPAKGGESAAGELGASERAFLNDLLTHAGAAGATLRSMERTPERQVSVMLRLAQEDIGKAKAMYCAAGDRVLERFDASAAPEKNHAAMLVALVAVLPEAREAGCLNHIRNSDVLSVDIKLGDVPEGQRANFVKAAEAAVSAGKVARFLAPPREPDAFHFEFKRRPE